MEKSHFRWTTFRGAGQTPHFILVQTAHFDGNSSSDQKIWRLVDVGLVNYIVAAKMQQVFPGDPLLSVHLPHVRNCTVGIRCIQAVPRQFKARDNKSTAFVEGTY